MNLAPTIALTLCIVTSTDPRIDSCTDAGINYCSDACTDTCIDACIDTCNPGGGVCSLILGGLETLKPGSLQSLACSVHD